MLYSLKADIAKTEFGASVAKSRRKNELLSILHYPIPDAAQLLRSKEKFSSIKIDLGDG